MIRLNNNYRKLQTDYLFVEIAKRAREHCAAHPERSLISLGIGDVVLPLPPSVIKAFHEGVEEQAHEKTFRGYGPEQGYEFLRKAIAENDFSFPGCAISPADIFVSDGAKCDSGNFQELFSDDIRVAVPDPVYPVYVDANVMAGRAGAVKEGRYEGLIYLEGTEDNSFVPSPRDLPASGADLVYLCFPNNPTGVAASRDQLGEWVEWALRQRSLILFDAAYEAFISNPTIPKSIYEIPGAEKCAVEFRSLSKTAGFTGTRLAYTVVPETIIVDGMSLHDMWNRRHTTKFNGVSYPVQRAAAAVFSPKGQRETRRIIEYYLRNAAIIRKAMDDVGYTCWGGKNSPYIWVKTAEDSWTIFDRILNEVDVVIIPGIGFGRTGEGFIRISAFNARKKVMMATKRIIKVLG